MKRPLFWKLLIGSWVTLIFVAVGNGWQVSSYSSSLAPWGEALIQRIERLELASAAQILTEQGPAGLVAFKARLPAGERLDVVEGVRPLQKFSELDLAVSQTVNTRWGVYTLTQRTPDSVVFPADVGGSFLRLPLQLLAVDFIGVSLFSLLFAHYLAGPIQRLRTGLERMAEGDLTVRVYAQIARRRDEMAELARNFDLMAERMQQLLEARERLLHDVSHELRSPLTRLLLAVELAHQNPERTQASLERIENEAQRLSEMVSELLTLSRAEFSAARSETYFAIADLVATVAADASYEAEPKGVIVATVLPDPSTAGAGQVINGSPQLLRKGIDNVLRNAVRISQSGQTVTVRLTPAIGPGGKLRIEVSDQGPGVPEDALESIFEPFVRLDGEPQGGGFGLGLAIARSAAHAHNGAVRAANRSAGGLSVVFELPVSGTAEVFPAYETGASAA